MDSPRRKTCENEQLKTQGKYFIEKFSLKDDAWDYSFKAVLKEWDKNFLSELKARKGGICNDVETQKGSKHCGLATSLMVSCFKDKDVTEGGGVHLDTWFEHHPQHHQQAKENCAKMVMLECKPKSPTPNDVCVAYLNAALKTGYVMMFSITDVANGERMDVMNVRIARREFKKGPNGPNAFITQHGFQWFFCKCKLKRITECRHMN